MKTVLVTGSNGLLGQKLTALLAFHQSIRLIATGLGQNRNQLTQGYAYAEMDVSSKESVEAVFEKYKPEVVIHCAAMTNVDACEKDPEMCNKTNVLAVEVLVNACKVFGIKLIHVSTDFIFDGTAGPYSEDDQPNPLSVYGHSKWEAEKIVQQAGIDYAIVRTVLVYGVVSGLSRSNIVLWVKESLEQQKNIQVVDDQFRSPTLAEDLADGIVRVLLQNKTGIYHISGPEFMNIYELACAVADFWKLDKNLITPVKSDILNQPAKRPPVTGFNISKAIEDLHYQPHSLKQGLQLLDKQIHGKR
jgi:dTDP-4-dehydrorhamnose reductase